MSGSAQWLRKWFARLFHFRDISALISLRGFIVIVRSF